MTVNFYSLGVLRQDELVRQDEESSKVARALEGSQRQSERLQTRVRLWLHGAASPAAVSVITVLLQHLFGNCQVEELNTSLQASQQELKKTTELLKQRDHMVTTLENGTSTHSAVEVHCFHTIIILFLEV